MYIHILLYFQVLGSCRISAVIYVFMIYSLNYFPTYLLSFSASIIFPSLFQKTVGVGVPLGGEQASTAVPPFTTPTSSGSMRNLSLKTKMKYNAMIVIA